MIPANDSSVLITVVGPLVDTEQGFVRIGQVSTLPRVVEIELRGVIAAQDWVIPTMPSIVVLVA